METATNDVLSGSRSAVGPKVSICLPVYNGADYLRQAIASVLGQSFQDFELVISDNASTDETPAICLEASTRDCRIRYFRADVNRGLAWNFNRAFGLATGKYLVWMGHDDFMEKEFISRCVEALEQETGTVLCFTYPKHVDENGEATSPVVRLQNPGASETASVRFSSILFNAMCDPVCGVMKTEVLKQTRLHGPYADSDRVLLVEMGLRGQFVLIPDCLFSRRIHAAQTTSRYTDRWERTLIFDPSRSGKARWPWVREFLDLIVAIGRAPVSRRERYTCFKYLYWWFCLHRRFIVEDLRRGLKCIFKRVFV